MSAGLVRRANVRRRNPEAPHAWLATFRSPSGATFYRLVQVRPEQGDPTRAETARGAAWVDRERRGKPCAGWVLEGVEYVGEVGYFALHVTRRGLAALEKLRPEVRAEVLGGAGTLRPAVWPARAGRRGGLR